MVKVVVSIINFRTAQMTVDCVKSVLSDKGDMDLRIVVIDNASQDGSAEFIADWIANLPPESPVSFLQSPTNSGFSGGHNQVITAEPDADYYLVLNSDALLKPGFSRDMLAAAKAAPQAGLITPQIINQSGEPQVSTFRFHSPLSELVRAASSSPITRLFARHVVALPPLTDLGDVEWVSFACVLLNAKMVQDIGPMDEGYFLYFEDAEYCLRAHRAGWQVAYAPQAHIVHFHGGSGSLVADEQDHKRLPRYYYASRTRFFYQAYGYLGLWYANLLWCLGRVFANTRWVLGKNIPESTDCEYRDIWINAATPLGRRYAPGETS